MMKAWIMSLPRATLHEKRGVHGCHENPNLTLEVYHSPGV